MASKSSPLSRRRVLKAAGAAAMTGGSALLGGSAFAQAPAVLTNSQAGRRFRAYVKFTRERPTIVELRARALIERQVLLRVEAAQTCYTNVDQCLIAGYPMPPNGASVIGHGGVGIVEAIGPQVLHTRVGDRVVVNLHNACGKCFNCLRMRSDKCMSNQAGPAVPRYDMADGTPVFGGTGAMAELMICNEEQEVSIFSDVSSAELSMLPCVGGCGLGMAFTNVPVDLGSDVVVFGAGPVGLSALMGAKMKGASQLIMVEPIRYRRELAMKLGATATLDPNQYKERKLRPEPGIEVVIASDRHEDALVEKIRDMCKMKNTRVWAGGNRIGPDHVMEAVGGDRLKPKEVQGPDPTGVTVLQQCWELCSAIGTLATCSVGQPSGSLVEIPATQWADGAKHHWGGTGGGTNDRRDVPLFARLMETGQLNMKAVVGATYPLSQAREAYQACADRTVISTVVTPTA
ncbi:MAG: alcohol dehydrogenase catalytic domain-containing protein [Vicinamibacterales bacterium]